MTPLHLITRISSLVVTAIVTDSGRCVCCNYNAMRNESFFLLACLQQQQPDAPDCPPGLLPRGRPQHQNHPERNLESFPHRCYCWLVCLKADLCSRLGEKNLLFCINLWRISWGWKNVYNMGKVGKLAAGWRSGLWERVLCRVRVCLSLPPPTATC